MFVRWRPYVVHISLNAAPTQEIDESVSPAEPERVGKLIHRLPVAGGHVSKTYLNQLLQRRGCPGWMQRMADQLQRASCLEGSDAKKRTTRLAGDDSQVVASNEG